MAELELTSTAALDPVHPGEVGTFPSVYQGGLHLGKNTDHEVFFKSIACADRPLSGVERSHDSTVDARSVDRRYRLRTQLMAWPLPVITTAEDTNVNAVPPVAV